MNEFLFAITSLSVLCISANAAETTIKITKKYLNLPVSHKVERADMTFTVKGEKERSFGIRLTNETPDYWVFCDLETLKGKNITISFPGNDAVLSNIYQSDQIKDEATFYKEENRPQLHFTSRRGWNNDPNGLIYYEGEYHLFYQHNPYERDWNNMHWGHAVSRDLIYWQELSDALYPDEHGTMFSGSAVIDYNNTAGFNKGNTPAMVAIYTADSPERQSQCIAYSLDKGRTWTKYDSNPVVDSKEKWDSHDTRDPKVFWYEPSNHWVMVLNERDGHSIYTSNNLKEWNFESHITGFWECPELFALPVDDNQQNKKWVMYGASGTYMIGSFDGKKFTPEYGKFYNSSGSIYAAQTFTNIPANDGRRIQIGWGRISHPEMPFNGCFLLPTELSLRTTPNGIRLFSTPVKEVDMLQTSAGKWHNISVDTANDMLIKYKDAATLRIKTKIKLSHATSAGLSLYGQSIIDYDMNYNKINGVFYSPLDMTSMEITADIIIDKTLIEVFIDNGAYSYSFERRAEPKNSSAFRFWGHNIEIKDLEVLTMESIWK